jgi:hypothetical protein
MAKKKKKAVKKAAKKSARRITTAPAATEAELQDALLVTWAAEGVLGACEYRDFGIFSIVRPFPVTVEQVSSRSSTAEETNGERGLDYARRQFARRDYADMPYLRVYGRVMEILLNHRRFQTCSAGDVFRVFLAEIPGQLKEDYRQGTPLPGKDYDVAEQPGRKTFNNRMKKLSDEELVRATVTRGSGREEDYVLTEDGQILFDGWPALSDIPGLELHAPHSRETTTRRRNP